MLTVCSLAFPETSLQLGDRAEGQSEGVTGGGANAAAERRPAGVSTQRFQISVKSKGEEPEPDT